MAHYSMAESNFKCLTSRYINARWCNRYDFGVVINRSWVWPQPFHFWTTCLEVEHSLIPNPGFIPKTHQKPFVSICFLTNAEQPTKSLWFIYT